MSWALPSDCLKCWFKAKCDLELLNGKIGDLVQLAEEQDGEKVILKLKEIVPEYDSKAGAGH